MARIPRSLLDELTREVNATSEAGRRMVAQALDRLIPQFVGEDGAVTDAVALRDAAIALMEQSVSYLVDVSAGCAAEHYDAVRAIQSPAHAYSASVLSGRDPLATEGAVRALVQKAVDGRLDAFVSGLADRTDYEVRRAANECMALNCGRDPDKPRYCRVPSGSETCGFCLMLASFGFHWTSPEAASHAHAGCDCRVEPDFGGASIGGYDPDGMYGRYNDLLDSLGGRDGLRADWDAMPDAKREAYIQAHDGKAGKAFDAYVNRRMAQVVESRDPTWFKTGVVPPPDADKVRIGANKVTFDERKLTQYSLNPERQPDKARAWRIYLGYQLGDYADVMDRVYEYVAEHDPTLRNTDSHGKHFTSKMIMTGKDGRRAKVQVGWVLDPGATELRLVTVYVDE